jgi:hypothetical protein
VGREQRTLCTFFRVRHPAVVQSRGQQARYNQCDIRSGAPHGVPGNLPGPARCHRAHPARMWLQIAATTVQPRSLGVLGASSMEPPVKGRLTTAARSAPHQHHLQTFRRTDLGVHPRAGRRGRRAGGRDGMSEHEPGRRLPHAGGDHARALWSVTGIDPREAARRAPDADRVQYAVLMTGEGSGGRLSGTSYRSRRVWTAMASPSGPGGLLMGHTR